MLFINKITSAFSFFTLGSIRFAAGLVRFGFNKSRYRIKRGYIHQKTIIPHDDRGHTDENQKEVYQHAAQWMEKHNLTSVIDIGCGSGYKLITYLGDFSTLGIDVDPVISLTKSLYPQKEWMDALDFNPSNHSADLILCADTIEHILDPAEFMNSIISIQHWKYMIFSTPDRNSKRGWHHFGPSPNSSHYREWSKKEFYRFISGYCQIIHHEIINTIQGTQFVICQKRKDKIN